VPLFQISDEGIQRHSASSFADLQLRERQDLQRLLVEDISPIDPDLLVISEEYGNWEDARRRIDVLAIDKEGRLVVIELKRTEDGGHMDLQALRYAAMISAMPLDEVLAAFGKFLERTRPDEKTDARQILSNFLEQEEDAIEIAPDVRIILVSRDFGREITTAVLWLNEFEPMDIRCVRLVPYEVEGSVLLDVQQMVPLPEAEDYRVRLRRKDKERERTRTDGRDFSRYHIVLDGEPLQHENKRRAMRTMVKALIDRGCSAEKIAEVLGPRKFRGIDGRVTDPDALVAPMEAKYPKFRFDPGRYWTDDLIHQDGQTWALTKMWGTDIESGLSALEHAFPESGVTFRRASAGQ
jgi:hypothetical protein